VYLNLLKQAAVILLAAWLRLLGRPSQAELMAAVSTFASHIHLIHAETSCDFNEHRVCCVYLLVKYLQEGNQTVFSNPSDIGLRVLM